MPRQQKNELFVSVLYCDVGPDIVSASFCSNYWKVDIINDLEAVICQQAVGGVLIYHCTAGIILQKYTVSFQAEYPESCIV